MFNFQETIPPLDLGLTIYGITITFYDLSETITDWWDKMNSYDGTITWSHNTMAPTNIGEYEYHHENTIHLVTEERVREIIKEEIKKYLDDGRKSEI